MGLLAIQAPGAWGPRNMWVPAENCNTRNVLIAALSRGLLTALFGKPQKGGEEKECWQFQALVLLKQSYMYASVVKRACDYARACMRACSYVRVTVRAHGCTHVRESNLTPNKVVSFPESLFIVLSLFVYQCT